MTLRGGRGSWCFASGLCPQQHLAERLCYGFSGSWCRGTSCSFHRPPAGHVSMESCRRLWRETGLSGVCLNANGTGACRAPELERGKSKEDCGWDLAATPSPRAAKLQLGLDT